MTSTPKTPSRYEPTTHIGDQTGCRHGVPLIQVCPSCETLNEGGRHNPTLFGAGWNSSEPPPALAVAARDLVAAVRDADLCGEQPHAPWVLRVTAAIRAVESALEGKPPPLDTAEELLLECMTRTRYRDGDGEIYSLASSGWHDRVERYLDEHGIDWRAKVDDGPPPGYGPRREPRR